VIGFGSIETRREWLSRINFKIQGIDGKLKIEVNTIVDQGKVGV
jgi:hypothetical protein